MNKVVAIDFETANNSLASVCAIGVSVLEDGAISDEYYSLIKPEENVNTFYYRNTLIHGIKQEDVEKAPTFDIVYKHIQPYFEDAIVVAHNARFDMGCLKETCLNCGIPVPHLKYFDTVELSKKVFRKLPHHRLNDICEYLNIDLNHHNADSDASACLMIVAHVMSLTGIYDIEEMLRQCQTRVYEL